MALELDDQPAIAGLIDDRIPGPRQLAEIVGLDAVVLGVEEADPGARPAQVVRAFRAERDLDLASGTSRGPLEAERIATDAYQRTRGEINLSVEDCFIQQRFSMYRLKGRVGELEATIEEASSRYGKMSNFVLMHAVIALARGDQDEARKHLDWACANDFEEIGEQMLGLFTMMLAAEVCVAVGSRDQAREIYERLLPHSGRCVTINFVCFDGPVDRALGLLADRLGETGTALGHFDDAIELMRRMTSRAWLAQCLIEATEIGGKDATGAQADRWDECEQESKQLAKRYGFVRF